jgi:hypothetical protein
MNFNNNKNNRLIVPYDSLEFQEARALVEILDVNGSSDLDISEWRRFYNARRISLSEFGEFLYF